MPYQRTSNEVRELVIGALVQGDLSVKQVATTFQVNYRTVLRIYEKFNRTGRSCKEPQGGQKPLLLDQAEIDGIQELIDENCTISLEKIQEILEIGTGKRLSIATIANYIGRYCRCGRYRGSMARKESVCGLVPHAARKSTKHCIC